MSYGVMTGRNGGQSVMRISPLTVSRPLTPIMIFQDANRVMNAHIHIYVVLQLVVWYNPVLHLNVY